MIEGVSIYLRTVREGDLTDLYAFLSSIRHKGEFLPSDLVSEHLFRLSFYETGFWSDEKGTVLVVKGNRVIGALWFDQQALFDCLDLHFYIFREEDRNKGYMNEALPLFCAYLFSTKKIVRLQISVPDYSKAALRVTQKCGFSFEGIARSAFFHKGTYLDLCIYSLLRSECKEIEKIY